MQELFSVCHIPSSPSCISSASLHGKRRIQRDIQLNIWQARDLTLFGRKMFVQTLGLSKLVYEAAMLRVAEMVIKRVQEKITKFL